MATSLKILCNKNARISGLPLYDICVPCRRAASAKAARKADINRIPLVRQKPDEKRSSFQKHNAEKLSWREQKISNAMKAYLSTRRKHDAFMEQQVAEYEIGKRFLANMMGEDVNDFTQDKIDEAIDYLFPSGLFEKKARPQMKHPVDALPKAKVAAFDMNGRPFQHLFYTGKPNFYNIMFEAARWLTELRDKEEQDLLQNVRREYQPGIGPGQFISHNSLMKVTNEKVTELDYDRMRVLLNKLRLHPMSAEANGFLSNYFGGKSDRKNIHPIRELETDAQGREYSTALGKRKTSEATVRVYANGTGNVTINGQRFLRYFYYLEDREKISQPLKIADLLGAVDIEASVQHIRGSGTVHAQLGATSSHSTAVALGVARALEPLCDAESMAKIRNAGLLVADGRNKERKKAGQKRARKKFTWKAR